MRKIKGVGEKCDYFLIRGFLDICINVGKIKFLYVFLLKIVIII